MSPNYHPLYVRFCNSNAHYFGYICTMTYTVFTLWGHFAGGTFQEACPRDLSSAVPFLGFLGVLLLQHPGLPPDTDIHKRDINTYRDH